MPSCLGETDCLEKNEDETRKTKLVFFNSVFAVAVRDLARTFSVVIVASLVTLFIFFCRCELDVVVVRVTDVVESYRYFLFFVAVG